MQTFEYVAVARDGRHVEGIQHAEDEATLDRALDAKGLVLTSAQVLEGRRSNGKARLSRSELVSLTTQLATVTGAGVPIVEGLEGIGQRMESQRAQDLLEHIVAELRGGRSFSQTLEPYPKVFPAIYTASIRAGESSGALDRILERLAGYLEWARAMRATAVQALIYPAILMAAIGGLIALLLLFVLPRILGLFPEGAELPWQTQVVMSLSDGLRENLVAAGIATGLSIAGVVWLLRTPRGQLALHRFLLRVPKLGPLVNKLAMSRFASTAATLQEAGCEVFTVLEISAETCGNRAVHEAFERSIQAIRRGKTMSQAFDAEPLIDPLLVQMVHVGEQSGALDMALMKLARHYDEEIPRAVKRFLTLLEPTLLLGAGGIVTFILLAAVLPLFQLYDDIG